MIRWAVITASFGCHDPLQEPEFVAPGVQYLCATERELPRGSAWRCIPLPATPTPLSAARRFKLLLHDHAHLFDAYAWIDSRFALAVDPRVWEQELMRHDLLALPHPFCRSVAEEAAEVARRGLVPESLLQRQLVHYRSRRFAVEEPPHRSTGLLVRRNDERTRQFNRRWYAELERFGHQRDQMSFDFAVQCFRVAVGELEGDYLANPYATWSKEGAVA